MTALVVGGLMLVGMALVPAQALGRPGVLRRVFWLLFAGALAAGVVARFR